MPITPLHCGVLAPVNHFYPGKVSNISFVLVNLWIDHKSIENVIMGTNLPAHDNHNIGTMLITATIVAVLGIRSTKWVMGAYHGAVTHFILDAMVHAHMDPFDTGGGNPFYLGIMGPLSLLLIPFMIWFIQQNVSSCGDWIRKRRAA